LFIERCLKLLKPEGILGIVVPDGVLSNTTLKYVRDFIKDDSVVKAVVSLPRETFLPYGSGVKASLLFLQKKDIKNKIKQEDIFMANAEEIGYDATGRSWGENELNNILVGYQNSKLSHSISERFKEKIYWTKFEDLRDRLDVMFYRPKYLEVTEKLERGLYPLLTIGDISEVIVSGATPLAKSDAYVSKDEGVPFIRIVDIKNSEIDFTNVLHIKREIHEGMLRRSRLNPNNVLLSIAGTIGVATVVSDNIGEANINQALARIALKDEIRINKKQVKLNPYYIAAFLNSDIGQIQTERFSRPIVQANINLQEVSAIKIPLPPSKIQDKIAYIVKRGREEAKKLKKEAEEIAEKAKKEVEKMIVGGS
jgi:type I restriction enzyme M protein